VGKNLVLEALVGFQDFQEIFNRNYVNGREIDLLQHVEMAVIRD
jgi:hypothetical protein